MLKSKFHYNKHTCQYEPATVDLKAIITYCLGVLFFSAGLFAGMAALYNRFTESESETALRKENNILNSHQLLVITQLSEVETILNELKKQDHTLHQKLFDETSTDITASLSSKKNILLADASDFTDILETLDQQSTYLNAKSRESNKQFNTISINKTDFEILNALPTLQPILSPDLDIQISGFGIRINPFHKGKYKHPGIDFAAPRGTEVFAAGPGRVINVSKSDLQAGYGNAITIDHGHGFITRYAHLEDIKIKPGQKITKGMIIGTVGNSGGSIAPHLHYEIIHKNENVDPMTYMIEGIGSHDYKKLITLSKKQNQSLD